MSCPCSSVHAGICQKGPHPAWFLFGPPGCSVVSSPDCRASLNILCPYIHAPLPFLNCRKLGGVSKPLHQVWVNLMCLESTLLLPTPHWGQRNALRLPPFHLPRHRYFFCALTMLHEEDSGVLKPPWSLFGDASQASSSPGFLLPDGMNWGGILNSNLRTQ